MIYLDHAATTPLDDDVLQAMLPYLQNQYGNASSSYALGRSAKNAIDAAKVRIASLIGADAQEIYMTSGGTEADNWALFGVMRTALPEKNHLIVSSIEHHAVLRCCKALEREGFCVTYAPVDRSGVVDIEAVQRAITPRTALISVMLANNEVGTIQPVREIAALAHAHGALMHTDAVQAAGHIGLNVDELSVDLLSMSAHKFYGPKGIGALYMRKGTRVSRFIHGGEQEKGLRAGTENVAGIVGMGKAAEIATMRLEADRMDLTHLRDLMVAHAKESLPSVTINGADAMRLPGHVHMTIDNADATLLLMQLDMQGIAASSGSACASGITERSHVIHAMGIAKEHQADLRFTFGRQNTQADVMKTIDVLKCILGNKGDFANL